MKLPFITTLTGYHPGLAAKQLYPLYQTNESNIVDIEGMPLHYRVTGKGPALLLIHGVMSSVHTWNGWHDQLSKNFQVISFDVPSFGLTGPHPKRDYSIEMYLRVIDKLLDYLGIEQCYMAGNSFGGFITWHYALYRPERLHKIILLDAAGIGSNPQDIELVTFKLFITPILKYFAHRFTPKFVLQQSLRRVYGDASKITSAVEQTYWHLLLRKGNREGFSTVLGKTILNGQDNTPRIKQITVPTLIMWGDQDHLIPVRDATAFQELIPNSKLIVYKGVGHIPMEEIPVRSAKDAQFFLLNE